jgi:hypothetical protein
MKQIALILTFLLSGILISCNKEEEKSLDINSLIAVWELDKFIDKNNNTLIAPKIQISFRENNCLTVFTSYNHGQGEFSVKGSKVTLRNLELTKREYDLENDNRFIRNLTGSYLINGDTLRILSDYDFDMVLYKTQIKDTYQGDLTTLLIDTIDRNRYYSEEILDAEYLSIYGKWFVYSNYGGFGGGELRPHFDFLEFKRNGIYGVVNNFDLYEYGSFYIESKLDDGRIVLNFVPDNNFMPDSININYAQGWSYIRKRLTFSGNDTIIFQDFGCLDCWRYSFVKMK